MRRASKRCSTPGCTNKATPSGYCAEIHTARHEAALRRTTPTKRARTTAVRKHRAAAVQAHLDEHDGMGHCPGYGRPPHVVFPGEMTADDPVPISRGGDPMQPLVPMCRSCNSRRGARGMTDATMRTMQASDITDAQVVAACIEWNEGPGDGWVTDLLIKRYDVTYDVAEAAMDRADDRGLIDWGVSLRGAWATPEGRQLLTTGEPWAEVDDDD